MLEAQLEESCPDLFAPVTGATAARFSLIGAPLPWIEDALRIGERFRQAVMSVAGQVLDKNKIPAVLSGHNLPAGNRHGHAFYLPEDADGDGCIDRLTVYVPGGIDRKCHRVLVRLTRLLNVEGGRWWIMLEHIGGFRVSPLSSGGTAWIARNEAA